MTATDDPVWPDPGILIAMERLQVSGVTFVTAMHEDQPVGLSIDAFAKLTLATPSVMICAQRTTPTHATLERVSHLAIHVASTDQLQVIASFASKNVNNLEEVAWSPARFGSPIIAKSSAYMEVEIRERLQGSTHTVLMCRIVDAEVGDRNPVIRRDGRLFHGEDLKPLA